MIADDDKCYCYDFLKNDFNSINLELKNKFFADQGIIYICKRDKVITNMIDNIISK
jgi:hypothetical protein